MGHINSASLKTTFLVDIFFIAIVYLTPIIAHSLSFPVYLLDPMRWCVLGSYLMLRNRNNALFLALSLPLISYAITGHPILFKNIIIGIELMANILLMEVLLKKVENVFTSVFMSIMVSKLIYYSLKTVLIYLGLLATNVFDTSIIIQIVVSALISLIFAKLYRK